METLSLRMDRILSNSLELARWLSEQPFVESVNYPGLENHPSHSRAKKYLKGGFGGVLFFTLKGDKKECARFVESLSLITHLVNIGDNKTLVSHPASTTHAQLNPRELLTAGIRENMLRFSLGIENIDDIKSDIKDAIGRI